MANGLQRHITGTYLKRVDVDNAKNEIVRKGITDAFVVAYLNGKRITLAEARKYEDGSTVPPTPTVVVPPTTPVPAPAPAPAPKVAPAPAVKTETPIYNASDIVFRIQIGAFTKPLDAPTIENYKKVLSENIEQIITETGLYIYLFGAYKDYTSAAQTRDKAFNNGISDAFVVAYHKNNRMPLNKARELLK